MTTQQEKVLKPKLGLLELARQLGNVSQACQIMGYSRDTLLFWPLRIMQSRRNRQWLLAQ